MKQTRRRGLAGRNQERRLERPLSIVVMADDATANAEHKRTVKPD
jgi:hypothetical protein